MKKLIKIAVGACLFGALLCSAQAASNPFADVNESDWFYTSVQDVYERGLMNGTSATAFSPAANITRGMIVTVLHRQSGAPAPKAACPFGDVASTMYFCEPIAWAAEQGLVTGYSADRFGPSDPITREQMATILYRYAKKTNRDVSARGSLNGFSDVAAINNYAVEGLSWANATGLIRGVTATTLEPQSKATRAQAAAILSRFCGEATKESADKTIATVSFQLNFTGAKTYKTITAEKGAQVKEPATPQRSGYEFLGWYTMAAGGTRYDFSTPVQQDFSLYAHWRKRATGSSSSSTQRPSQEETLDVGTAVDAASLKDGANLFILQAVPSSDGKQVTVTVLLDGTVKLCGFDLKLRYSKSIFRLREVDEEQDLQVVADANEALGEISFNYSTATNIKKAKTVLIAEFDVIGAAGKTGTFVLSPTDIIMTDEQNGYEIIPAEYTVTYTRVTAP